MTATVVDFPGAAPTAREPVGLHLSQAEVEQAAGGYKRAADQLRELHARGFTRATLAKVGRKRVLLERGHYEAVVSGQYAPAPAPAVPLDPATRAPLPPNRAGYRAKFGRGKEA